MAASSDPEGAPGTWKKWDGEGFTIEGCNKETQIGGKPALIKGLQSVLGSNPSVMWNDYLQKWIMVYAKWGGDIYVSSSIDGIEWSTPALLLTESINPLYPNLVSEYGDLAGGKSIRLYYSKDQQENGIRKLAYRKIVFYDSNTNNITFTDARVKALRVANWDANNDGELNEAEAAVVTDLGTVFKGNKLIKSFDELQYFTGLNNIANGAFQGCTKLISISIPNNVARIGEHAFEGSGLTRIAIPNGITTIGNWAFQLCENLETVFLPESVENIGGAAFAYCPKLSTINLPSRLRVLSDWLFTNCVAIRSIQIPHSVTTILNNCFQGSGLQSIIIPDGVTSIENNAFLNCKNLSSITLGNGLTSVVGHAFSGCSSLTNVYCYAEAVPSASDDTFDGTNIGAATLYVPKASMTVYKTTKPWSDFGSIVPIEGYTTYTINDEMASLYISTEESGCNATFTHDFNGEWEALYLPFAIDYDAIKADFDLAEIDGVVQNDDDNDGTIDFTVLSIRGFKEQMTKPNKPYLIRAKNTGEQTINFEDVTVYPTTAASIDCSSTSTKYEFTGSYNTLEASALANHYIVQVGELVKGASSLAPCRWYMTATARDSAPLSLPNKIRILSVDDVITGVSRPSPDPSLYGGEIYEQGSTIVNLAGQQIGNGKLPKGINIIRRSDGTTTKVLKR